MWYAIVLAGGGGTRMLAGKNKVLLPVAGMSMLSRSVRAVKPLVDGLVVVIRPEDEPEARELLARDGLLEGITLVPGGADRQTSVWNGLQPCPRRPGGCWFMMGPGAWWIRKPFSK